MPSNSRFVWTMDLNTGKLNDVSKFKENFVQCVRVSKKNKNADVQPKQKLKRLSPTGTIIDQSTGLMWQKKTDGKKRSRRETKKILLELELRWFYGLEDSEQKRSK